MRFKPWPNGFLAFSLALLCMAAIAQGDCSAAEGRTPALSEYRVKAAFVYNFIKFVEWPDAGGPSGREVRLCILGELPDAADFAGLNGQHMRGKNMAVTTLRQASETGGCDVLFIAANQAGRLRDIIKDLDDLPILTIGDTEGYARQGVMINMFLEGKRIRFEINEERARAAGLRISAKLLKLADMIHGGTAGKEP